MEISIVLLAIAIIFVIRAIRIVPQQSAWVVERLGKYTSTLSPGLNILIPFIDKVAYKHYSPLRSSLLSAPSESSHSRAPGWSSD